MNRVKGLLCCLVLVGLFLAPVSVLAAKELVLPFQETFDTAQLDSGWTIDASPGNNIKIKKGLLEIDADQNTYAHIERPLGVDLVRAAALLKSADGASWATSVFLYWDTLNWCQFTVRKAETGSVGVWYQLKGGGSFIAVETVDGITTEYMAGPTYYPRWHHLAIELGTDCIRYQCSTDGKLWVPLRISSRPEKWRGKAPQLLIVGKGFSRKEAGQVFTATDLDNDYPDRGPRTTTLIREISVEATPNERKQMTQLEKQQLKDWGHDFLGEMELSRPGGPVFESVSSHFPELLFPREIIGLKDHPEDIGIGFDGSIQLQNQLLGHHLNETTSAAVWEVGAEPVRLGWRAGSCKKRLLNGYMPIVICEYEHDGLLYEQAVFGYSQNLALGKPMFAFSRMTVKNPSELSRSCDISLRLQPTSTAQRWKLNLKPGKEQSIYAKVPYSAKADDFSKIDAREYDKLLDIVQDYWKELLSEGIYINVPEKRVNDARRAWLAYNFLNVDKTENTYNIFDGSSFYDALFGFSAAHQMRCYDLMGYHEDTEKYLNANISLVNEEGLYITNFGLPDNGALLVAIADHYRITGNKQWLHSVAPTVIRMCDWVIKQRAKDARRAKGVARGLIFFRPYADYPQPAYSYFTDTYLCVSMEAAADVLGDIGMKDVAKKIAAEAVAYRKDILKSMDSAVLDHEGMKILPIMPETQALLKLSNYRADDYHGMLCSMLLDIDFLDPRGKRALWLVDTIEKRGGLSLGCLAWRGGIDHAYLYGYLYNCLQRNEPDRAVLGLYGWMAYGMSRTTYCGVEVTNHRSGDNHATLPHGYSGTEQMRLLRMMLVRSEGDDLLLGQAVPRQWLEPGKKVEIKKAPTIFGEVSYSITAKADSMTVKLDPPTRNEPAAIRLFLRHPQYRNIVKVRIEGKACNDFTGDSIRLAGLKKATKIQVEF